MPKREVIGAKVTALLLEHGAAVNAVDGYNETPLYEAAFSNHLATARLLIAHGADLQVRSKRVDTPTLLHAAVRGNSAAMVELFHANGLKLDDSLFYSAQHGEIMAYLVAHQLNINTKCVGGETPLHRALYAFSATIIENLLANGADASVVDERGVTPLQALQTTLANHDGFMYDVERKLLLLHLGVGDYTYKSGRGVSLLHTAAALDQHYAIDQLLAHGVNINIQDDDGNTPLMTAVQSHDLDALQFLLAKPGIKVNLANNARIAPLQMTLLPVRSRGGGILNGNFSERYGAPAVCAQAELLLVNGALPAQAAADGKTAFDLVNAANPEFWPLLLRMAGVAKRYDFCAANGITTLHLAAGLGAEEPARRLLAAKVDANARDNAGRTPLSVALRCRQFALAKLLVETGCDVTLADKVGMTPLHVLVDNSFPPRDLPKPAAQITDPQVLPLIDLLLAHGADINARNAAGKTPLGLVYPTMLPAIREKLIAKGGKE
jgi:ankyrin repeat protein